MRKFKHLPSGKIFEQVEADSYMYVHYDMYVHYADNGYKNIVEAQIPEYIVTGKDWEEIFDSSNKLFIITEFNVSNQIYSVKRLRDGMEFTIGDKIDYHIFDGTKSSLGPISITKMMRYTRYSRYYKEDIIFYGKDRSGTEIAFCNISDDCFKVEKLLTTDDGVDIYTGDKITGVYLKDPSNPKVECIDYPVLRDQGKSWKGWKLFSTKEKAERYVLLNKQCLSIEEIANALALNSFEISELEKLVKSKK